jgi:predicted nucleic-acid-binding Zn-ribbon protein
MKNTKKCPKCSSSSIKRFESEVGAFGVGNYIPVGMKSVPVNRYVCLQCGYVEEWIDSASNLKKIASD